MTEAAWDRLWSQLTLQDDGFWLGFVAGVDLGAVSTLQQRTDAILRRSGRRLQAVHAEEPADLLGLMGWVLGDHPASGALWLTGLSRGHHSAAWLAGWDPLFRRLNEQRDVLASGYGGGVVLAGPPGLVTLARELAPDLWSYRSVVIHPDRPAGSSPARADFPSPPTSPDVAAFVDRALKSPGVVSEPVWVLTRRAASRLRSGLRDQAVAAAEEAMRCAESADDRAIAGAWLARATARQGDTEGARELACEALRSQRPLGERQVRELLELLAASPRREEADWAVDRLVALSRRQLADEGEQPQHLRRLAAALVSRGRIAEEADDTDRAVEAFVEALALMRRNANLHGVDVDGALARARLLQALGNLAGSTRRPDLLATFAREADGLSLVAPDEELAVDARRVRTLSRHLEGLNAMAEGDLVAAEDHLLRAAELEESLLTTTDEADGRGNLAAILVYLGDLARATGDGRRAEASYRHALGHGHGDGARVRLALAALAEDKAPEARLLLSDVELGAEPLDESERLLRVHAFTRLGLALAQNDSPAAETALVRALVLARRAAEGGHAPAPLRSLVRVLVALGAHALARGEPSRARGPLQEALDIARRRDTPQDKRLLAEVLIATGDAERALGNLGSATAAYAEALDHIQSILSELGEDPDGLVAMVEAAHRAMAVAEDAHATDLLAETAEAALSTARRLLERYGETPQSLLLLAESLLWVARAGGENPVVDAMLREAAAAAERLSKHEVTQQESERLVALRTRLDRAAVSRTR